MIVLEPPAEQISGGVLMPLKVEDMPDPVELQLSPTGVVQEIAIPGLKKIIAAIAGEPQGKPGKASR